MGKAWPALEIFVPDCDPQLQELVLAELDDFHPTAIQEAHDPFRLRAFFDAAGARDNAFGALGAAFGRVLVVEPIDVDDEDWAARSQASLKAITVGRIVVAPPWDTKTLRESLSPDAGDKDSRSIFVVIDPSTGFGTGHHATTRLMLQALQNQPVDGRTVLDVGCGSGVLAIAAVKLGAPAAAALDVDPEALDNARENARLNEVADRVRFEEGDFRIVSARADLVMANLTGGLLQSSASTLAQIVNPGGRLIVSGFMTSEEATVIPAFRQHLHLETASQEDDWMCAVFSCLPIFQSSNGGASQ